MNTLFICLHGRAHFSFYHQSFRKSYWRENWREKNARIANEFLCIENANKNQQMNEWMMRVSNSIWNEFVTYWAALKCFKINTILFIRLIVCIGSIQLKIKRKCFGEQNVLEKWSVRWMRSKMDYAILSFWSIQFMLRISFLLLRRWVISTKKCFSGLLKRLNDH